MLLYSNETFQPLRWLPTLTPLHMIQEEHNVVLYSFHLRYDVSLSEKKIVLTTPVIYERTGKFILLVPTLIWMDIKIYFTGLDGYQLSRSQHEAGSLSSVDTNTTGLF